MYQTYQRNPGYGGIIGWMIWDVTRSVVQPRVNEVIWYSSRRFLFRILILLPLPLTSFFLLPLPLLMSLSAPLASLLFHCPSFPCLYYGVSSIGLSSTLACPTLTSTPYLFWLWTAKLTRPRSLFSHFYPICIYNYSPFSVFPITPAPHAHPLPLHPCFFTQASPPPLYFQPINLSPSYPLLLYTSYPFFSPQPLYFLPLTFPTLLQPSH